MSNKSKSNSSENLNIQMIIIADEKVDEYSNNLDIAEQQPKSQKTFICSVNNCGKEYRSEYDYKRHWRRTHSDKTVRCAHSGCNYVTADKGYLKRHLHKHFEDRPFTCSTDGCGKTFKTKNYLRIHKRIHNSKLIKCTFEECEQRFTTKRYLNLHINNIHSSKPKPFVCKDCGKDFETKTKRIRHQTVNHDMSEEHVVCQVNDCNKEFSCLDYYRDHLRRCHFGQEFCCDYSGCDYVTKRQSTAKKTREHTFRERAFRLSHRWLP